jgi:excisionase family DNA binding protein
MTRGRFITVAEAAEVLNISVEAVRGQIKRGTLVFMQYHKI